MKIDFESDLKEIFSGFRWNIKGMVDEDGDSEETLLSVFRMDHGGRQISLKIES